MNKSVFKVISGIVLAGALICGVKCIERIPAGYVGVVYSMNGGVQDKVITQGWRLIKPSEKVTKYSIATEQLYLSQDEKEGNGDDSFDTMCKDGKMNIDLEMSYSFLPEKVPTVFKRYRGMSGNDIMNNVIRGKIKTYTNEVTSNFTVIDAHMEKKAELNKALTEHLRGKLAEFGVNVESANLSETRVDKSIEQAIIERGKANQELEAEKQKLEKSKVEADRKIVEAKGKAEQVRIGAEAEANANKLKQSTVTDTIVRYEAQKKWNGSLPQITGESIPMVDLPKVENKEDK